MVRKALLIVAALLVCLPSVLDDDTVAYEISAVIAWALVAIGLVLLARWGVRRALAERRCRDDVSGSSPSAVGSAPTGEPHGQPVQRRHQPVRVPQHGSATTQRCAWHRNKRKFATEAEAESFIA